MNCLDSVLQSVLKGLDLLLCYVSRLLSLGGLALKGSDDKLDLLLDDLSFHLSDSCVLFVDNGLSFLFSVKTVHDSKSGFEIVLVDFNLSKVSVHHLHGVLTG